jgi:hypothetical protein
MVTARSVATEIHYSPAIIVWLSLKDAFAGARALVNKRELRERFEPSNPLMAGGANVQPLLVARP